MEYTNLGSTGLKVSRLGFGGIPIQRITQEEATALIHKLPGVRHQLHRHRPRLYRKRGIPRHSHGRYPR